MPPKVSGKAAKKSDKAAKAIQKGDKKKKKQRRKESYAIYKCDQITCPVSFGGSYRPLKCTYRYKLGEF